MHVPLDAPCTANRYPISKSLRKSSLSNAAAVRQFASFQHNAHNGSNESAKEYRPESLCQTARLKRYRNPILKTLHKKLNQPFLRPHNPRPRPLFPPHLPLTLQTLHLPRPVEAMERSSLLHVHVRQAAQSTTPRARPRCSHRRPRVGECLALDRGVLEDDGARMGWYR